MLESVLVPDFNAFGIYLGVELLGYMGFPGGSDSKESVCQYETPGFNPWVGKIPLEKGMATHSSILAWRSPWTEEPGRLIPWGHSVMSASL